MCNRLKLRLLCLITVELPFCICRTRGCIMFLEAIAGSPTRSEGNSVGYNRQPHFSIPLNPARWTFWFSVFLHYLAANFTLAGARSLFTGCSRPPSFHLVVLSLFHWLTSSTDYILTGLPNNLDWNTLFKPVLKNTLIPHMFLLQWVIWDRFSQSYLHHPDRASHA